MISKKYNEILTNILKIENKNTQNFNTIILRDYQLNTIESLKIHNTIIKSPRQSGATKIGLIWIIDTIINSIELGKNPRIGIKTHNANISKKHIRIIEDLSVIYDIPFTDYIEIFDERNLQNIGYDYIFVDDYETIESSDIYSILNYKKAKILLTCTDYRHFKDIKSFKNIEVDWKDVPRYKDGVLLKPYEFKSYAISKFGHKNAYDMFGIPSITKINNILLKSENSKKMKDADIKPSQLFNYFLDGLCVDDLIDIKRGF